MEIYKSLDNKASKEFEELLNNQLSQSNVEEGKIVKGIVTKITEKFVFLYISGLKSEPVLYLNELKTLKIDNIEIGSKIPVLIETLENKHGEVVVSASKAKKIDGWNKIVKLYENKELISGKIVSRTKGGVIIEHIETGSLLFCPASQLDTKPLKDISHLMNTPLNFIA
jgi:Ribosomal protein S1